jgi:polyhydroxybutyrate depolymerase
MKISHRNLHLVALAALAVACNSTETPASGTGGTAPGTGGSASTSGGAPANTGGAATSSGGTASPSGGQAPTGGTATASGGAPSGGAASGGKATGGNAAGGQPATDGGTNSPGCGVTGSATGAQSNLQITVGSQTRTYVLFVPTSYSPSTAMPLVFGYHGLGGSGTMARQYFQIEQAANNKAIFVYPDGLASGDGGQATWSFSNTSADTQFFDALVTKITSTYCIDMNRIFVTGHSMGGVASNALGCYRGNVIRAIAPVAGMPPNAYGGTVTCSGNVAAWIAHGDNDATVDFTRGGIASRDFWIAQNGCSTTTVTDPTTPNACVDYQGCRPDLPVIWCVHNEGHNWPNTGYGCDGGVCFNAGPAIWTFFASFT